MKRLKDFKHSHFINTFIILFLMCSFIYSGIIIPDPQNPFLISNPSISAGSSTLTFNFQLPSNSKGLQYKQFIAVRFPASDSRITNLGLSNFLFINSGSAICKLFKDANTIIDTLFVPSLTSDEANICYCQINDFAYSTTSSSNGRVPLKTGITYRFEITLPNASQKPSAIFWRNFDLYTTTSNNLKAQYIDSGFSFASGAIFDNYSSVSNDVVSIVGINKVDYSYKDITTNTYHYEKFNIRLQLRIQAFIRGVDLLLYVKFPTSDLVAALPITYFTTDVDSSFEIKKKAKTSLLPTSLCFLFNLKTRINISSKISNRECSY